MKKIILTLFIITATYGHIQAQSNLYLSPATTKTADNSLVISLNGNVGIGKANPQTKLEVNGRVHAKSVKVDLEGWADFVFDPDYKLTPLQQVEAYIKQHGHLPEIPSAEEAIANGIDLGEINTLLLQKVEELTLYMIQKEKEVSDLQTRLSKLESLVLEKK